MKLFEDYAKANNMDEEELEQILSKNMIVSNVKAVRVFIVMMNIHFLMKCVSIVVIQKQKMKRSIYTPS
ncbi:hypothetical protein, partial [Aliarcobacter butzleri]|uniref:hypothetical protein n=1 Tax=Aliarcobacter butzleri TaxID=28197 RepID=UPI003B210033